MLKREAGLEALGRYREKWGKSTMQFSNWENQLEDVARSSSFLMKYGRIITHK